MSLHVDPDRLGQLADRILEVVGERAEAEVLVSSVRSGLTRFANSGIHQHVGEDEVAVQLRVATGGRVASVRTTRTDADHLEALVERALGAAAVRREDPDWPGLAAPQPLLGDGAPAAEPAGPDQRAGEVAAFVEAAADLRAAGYVDAEQVEAVFASSAGQRLTGGASRATVDGIHQTATSAGKGHQTGHALDELDGGAAGAGAARLARDSADPSDLEPGTYEVVLSPECVASIAAFLCYYGFNAKAHLEGQSFAELGVQQFDPAVALWDDASDPRAIGLPFDSEGTVKRRLDLIDRGVTSALAHDRRTAKRAGAESTGHALPGGEAWGAFPTNIFLGTGDASADDLVAAVDRGLLVTEFNYCRILDPKTQVVTGLTRNGTFVIEGGEVRRPVSNLRFTQSFVEALAPGQVLGVGAEARFADDEFGTGMCFVPAVRLAEWHFTGGAQG